MAAQEIKVPDIGDFDAVEVIEVLVAKGDTVDVEQPLITLESDKATLEVPTTVAGTIAEIKVKEGDSVKQGDVIALLEEGSDAAAPADDADDNNDNADETPQSTEASEDQPRADDARQKPAASQSEEDIKVPDIGDLDAVEVIEVLVAVGDTVQLEDSLITLESDKATLEVPSPSAGTLTSIKVKEGDKVGYGDVIATVATTGDAAAASEPAQKDEPAPAQQSAAASEQPQPSRQDTAAPQRGAPVRPVQAPRGSQLTSVDEAAFAKAHASPAVRKYARELGVDLGRVQGSGRKERILSDDVNTYVKAAVNQLEGGGAANGGGGGLPTQPDVDYSQFGEIEIVDLPRIRKLSAQAVHKNWLLIPHVTQFDEADITDMEAFRQEQKTNAADQGIKLTPLAFLLKASAAALKQFPDLNSSLSADSTQLVHKNYVHIGVAVDTEAGLLMPVVRDVDQKSIFQLAADLGDISSRAREGKLKPDEMKGASFSISSLGGVGGTAFTPIVNSPEVAMLGVSRSKMEPVWNGSEFLPRLILPLSLSYDHRVIDGVKAARITGFLSRALGDLRTLLL